VRLKAEVEKIEVQYNASLAQQQSHYSLELANLRNHLQEAESRRDALEKEEQSAKDKLYAAYLEELTDNEETIAELKRKHEQEKLMLLEDNKKLMIDLDSLTESIDRLQSKR
jgi:serine/threonine-protein kinase MRCK